MTRAAARLVYVYGVLEAAGGLPPDLRGIDGGAVSLVQEGSLGAAVSQVPAAEFGESALNERLQDMAWLGPRAVAHQAVNAAIFGAGTALLPLSFGTVFHRVQGVHAMLRVGQARLLDALARVREHGEWVLSVRRDTARVLAGLEAHSPALAALDRDIQAGSTGRAYLLRRRQAGVRRQEMARLDREVAAAVSEALGGLARATFEEPLAETGGAGQPAGVPRRLSLLVPWSGEDAFVAAVERLAATWRPRGYSLELSGPWPPYRFGGLSSAEGPGGAPAR